MQRVRVQMAKNNVNVTELVGQVPVEVGLQTEKGYPHKGVLDYASPELNQSTGTLKVRGLFENASFALLPGYYVRVRLPLRPEPALLVPEVAVGSDQGWALRPHRQCRQRGRAAPGDAWPDVRRAVRDRERAQAG
ncbi:MAG TPA: hypothetical protein VKB89_26595 [Xanthobacteraceae bacterium]|nr:hypothetical protein [Xanthobacteraceae bacterium]